MARDLDRVLSGLRRYLEYGPAITGVTVLSTGHSNETYLLEGVDRILRTPPSEEGLLPPYDMALQHAVFDAVADAANAPPVPRVFELCTDPSVIGDAFYVMERLDGEAFEAVVPGWLAAADETFRSELCEQWIGAISSVHGLAPLACLGPARTPEEEVDRWLRVADDAGSRELREVLLELGRHPLRRSGPPTLVHGDPKLANCLWHEGRLTGLLDWELAYNGDPLADLGYMLFWFPEDAPDWMRQPGFALPGFWDRKQVIEAWEAATDRSSVGVHRYEALSAAKIGAILATGAKLYAQGRASDPRFAYWDAGATACAQAAASVL